MNERLPRVSVVIPVKDDSLRLRRCLEALAAGDYQGELEVLVVDNGSRSPPVVDWSERTIDVRLFSQPEGGSYAARNAGIAASSGAIIAFTDSDCVPSRNWISAAVTRLEDDNIEIIAGEIVVFPRDSHNPNSIELYEMIHAFPQEEYVDKLGFGVTANLVARAEALKAVSGFNSHLLSGGDRDLCERLCSAKYVLIFDRDVVVYHPARASLREYYTKRLRVMLGALTIRAERGEDVRMPLGRIASQILPPRSAFKRAFSDPLLRSYPDRIRYVVAAILVRYLDVVAWRVAIRTTSRRDEDMADRG